MACFVCVCVCGGWYVRERERGERERERERLLHRFSGSNIIRISLVASQFYPHHHGNPQDKKEQEERFLILSCLGLYCILLIFHETQHHQEVLCCELKSWIYLDSIPLWHWFLSQKCEK
jgi:hypothetical protein